MAPLDRWSQITDLFHALVEVPESERQRVLATVEDEDLRVEVLTLLTTHDSLDSGANNFLKGLDSAGASTLLEQAGPLEVEPSSVDRYRISRRLARGGMGIVYQAHDPRLNRAVALKLLPQYRGSDPESVLRLTAEARAASALDHPNVQTVYEIGETGDGRVFIAMAYYDGETLRERIARGPMAASDTISLGLQLAEGLSAAHRSGIIHRDIKPENLLVTTDGVLKIVDFGVAKVLEEGPASLGITLGTAAYMSPEQTRGASLDQRTDIWSMGVVLYEMLAGKRPFRGDGEALIHGIRTDVPEPLGHLRPDLDGPLETVVERCLEKAPDRRYSSADQAATDLRAAQAGFPADREPRVAGRRLAWVYGAAVVAVIALAGVFGRRAGVPPPSERVDSVAAPGIAVLPFDVRGVDPGIWREGMVDLLSIGLDGAPGLRAINSRTVLARWRERAQGVGGPDLHASLEVALRTGAGYAVLGSLLSDEGTMRLGATIYTLPDGNILASLQVDGPTDSLFALVDRLTIDILAGIWQGSERPRRDIDLTRITTTSLPALKAYLEGEGLLRRSDFPGALAAYERAIAADSTFAFALYHQGLAYGWIGDGPNQNQSLERALRHVHHLPEREAMLLRAALLYYTDSHDVLSAVQLLRQVTQRYPDDPDAWYQLGEIYFHSGPQVLVTQDASEAAFRKVVELDPDFGLPYIHLVHNAFAYHSDSTRAANLVEVYHRLAPDDPSHRENQVALSLAFGDSNRRREALAGLDQLPTSSLYELAGILDHPRLWSLSDAVLNHQPLPASLPGRLMAAQRFDNALTQGHLRSALTILDDPLIFSGIRAAGLYQLQSAGLPVPDPFPELSLTWPQRSSAYFDNLFFMATTFFAGAYAGDRGRWEAHSAAEASIRAQADWLLVAGNAAGSRLARGAAVALQGQRAWRRGEAARALGLLTEAQQETTWVESRTLKEVNAAIRWWLGELLLEIERPREAVPYFESFWNDPFAAHRLGPVYEEIDDPTGARDAYALVASAWRDADPELQGRARSAAEAAQRLASSIKD